MLQKRMRDAGSEKISFSFLQIPNLKTKLKFQFQVDKKNFNYVNKI